MYIYDNFISIIQLLYYKSRTLNQSKHFLWNYRLGLVCSGFKMQTRVHISNLQCIGTIAWIWKIVGQFETPTQILNQYGKVVSFFLQRCYATKCSYEIFCKLHKCGDKSWNVNYHSIFEFSYMTACKLCYFWQQLYLSGQRRLSNIKCYD